MYVQLYTARITIPNTHVA